MRAGPAGETAQGLRLIGLPFAYVLLMLAAPLAMVVAFSFWTQDYLTVDTSPTLTNYRAAWGEPIYQVLMLRSLRVSLIVTAVTVLTAFPVAYYLSFHVTRRKALWLFLITVPFWTSYLLRVFLWKVILGYNGVLNSALMGMGLTDAPLTFLLYNANAVVITLAHAWAPFAILPIFVALEKIDRSLLEAAEDLGDPPVRRFRRITLPLAMPGIVAATLIVLIPTVGDFITPRLVGGTEGLMIANMIQIQFGQANDAPLGAALAVSSMVVVGVIAGAIYALGRAWGGRTA